MLEMFQQSINSAMADFYSARRQAQMEQLLARLTGKSAALLSYEEIAHNLRPAGGSDRGLQDIPLNAIVGSVGRYHDFTRSFLPRHDSAKERWINVQIAANDPVGLPPIEVYQLGQVYFVLDGNHRVSVARQMGSTHIEAHVTEIRTRVPLTPDIQPDGLIIKARYADFLEQTRLDEQRPGADLSVTAPGQYRILEEQIECHRQALSQTQQRVIAYQEAAIDWYDTVYLPVIEVIREQGILRDFPNRTETDLYAWLVEHRQALAEELNWEVKPQAVAAHLATQHSSRPQRILARMGEKLLDAVVPDSLDGGPPPGQWRREQVALPDRLFTDILVTIGDNPGSWVAMEYALEVARREEGGRLYGLHVVAADSLKEGKQAQILRAEFERRCQAVHMDGQWAVETGGVARTIGNRARWTDLVVVSLAYPPAPQPLARLSSGFRTLIRRSARPILAVPTSPDTLSLKASQDKLCRALLAYDGSLTAQEALFVATYLTNRWHMSLVVVAVEEKGVAAATALTQAQEYLALRGVPATFIAESGPVAKAILRTATAHQSNLLILGGYHFTPVVEVVRGSTLEQLLRQARQPLLICR